MVLELQVNRCSPDEWSKTASRFADYSIYQTWPFSQQSAAAVSAEVERVVALRKGEPIALAAVRLKRFPLVPGGIAYIYRGPLWRCAGSGRCDDLGLVLSVLREEYVDHRHFQLRISPNLESTAGELLAPFTRAGLCPMTAAPPERTICVDLEPPLEALRKNLAQKWRNGLNQAGRRGLSIAEGTSEDLMAEFEELYEAMWSKKRFESGVTVASFRALQRELPPTEKQRVLLARRDGRAVAGHVSSTLGDTCIYLLGASNEVGRETKASYLLQWRAMELAKEAGARRYDLGGIDPPRNPGVYHFKAGMGGIEVTFPASYAANGRGTGVLAPLLERGYRAWRGLRKNMEAIGT